MDAVKFKRMNAVYTAPGCEDLPALRREDEETGRETVTSVWKPTPEDLDILNAGGCVCLSIWGGQPPVSMWTEVVDLLDADVGVYVNR